jgi:glycosyltransferase involved in cell wall biosynthesis
MNIFNVNTYDTCGGAAIAAYRIHKGLCGIGINSKMLVQYKASDDKSVLGPNNRLKRGFALLRPTLDSSLKYLFACGSKNIFHTAWLPLLDVPSQIDSMSPDIVHLHWICDGMLRIEKLKYINKPIVWTLHDMWAFTGGCHYDDGCGRFHQICGNCPQLVVNCKNDLSRSVMIRKTKALNKLDITIVTPSNWLAECAKESSLFKERRIEIIPNGLDLSMFKPLDKSNARRKWGLPINKKLILFGAMSATSDHRKGFDLLYESLKQITAKWTGRSELIVFGSGKPKNPPDFGLPVHYLGQIQDDVTLSHLYSQSDIMVVPSRQDNLPNTVVESLACGTPVVVFDIGGMPDMVEHKVNGYLAKPFDTSDLAAGIDWVMSDDKRHKDLSIQARDKAVACFDVEKTARRYAVLYEDVITVKRRK